MQVFMSKKRTKLPKIKKPFVDSPFGGLLTHSKEEEKANFCQCPTSTNVIDSYVKFDDQVSLEYGEPSLSDPA